LETIWTGSFGFKVPKEFCGRDYDLSRPLIGLDGERERENQSQQRSIGTTHYAGEPNLSVFGLSLGAVKKKITAPML
jgi:hypothetical protein